MDFDRGGLPDGAMNALLTGVQLYILPYLPDHRFVWMNNGTGLAANQKTMDGMVARIKLRYEVAKMLRPIIEKTLAAELAWLREAGHDPFLDVEGCCRV
jgi:hypothetical protein